MSSVPAVLAALAALGVATLPNSQIINGGLESVTSSRGRLLLVGDDEVLITRDFDSLGGTTSEQYFVPLSTLSSLPGTDQTAADAMALADYEAMVQAVLDHPSGPTLGLEASGVLSVQPTGEHRFQRLANTDNRQAWVRFGVQVYAQIT